MVADLLVEWGLVADGAARTRPDAVLVPVLTGWSTTCFSVAKAVQE